ncbi:MAG: hypothetical protein K9M57_07085 [Phycisphaerae bacterium]|nr:hypothetical protein [Phycisphaerae bacterium]
MDKYGTANDVTYAMDLTSTKNLKNQYATVGGNSVSYDDAGNMTVDHRGYLYEYDYENRLERIYEMDGQNEVDIANYTYDALGRRIMVEDPIADTSTTYYYDGWRVLSEFEADTSSTPGPTIQRDFTWGNYLDEALVMTSTVSSVSIDHYYAHNHLYSPVALIDSAGTIEEYYEYDAYGKITAYTDAGADTTWRTADDTTGTYSAQGNPIAFTGQRLDSLDGGNFGIMYYKNRYYDVEIGRWLKRDPAGIVPGGYMDIFEPLEQYGDSINLYEYVGSNALIYVDPYGLMTGFGPIPRIPREYKPKKKKPKIKYYGPAYFTEKFVLVPGGVNPSEFFKGLGGDTLPPYLFVPSRKLMGAGTAIAKTATGADSVGDVYISMYLDALRKKSCELNAYFQICKWDYNGKTWTGKQKLSFLGCDWYKCNYDYHKNSVFGSGEYLNGGFNPVKLELECFKKIVMPIIEDGYSISGRPKRTKELADDKDDYDLDDYEIIE